MSHGFTRRRCPRWHLSGGEAKRARFPASVGEVDGAGREIDPDDGPGGAAAGGIIAGSAGGRGGAGNGVRSSGISPRITS